MAEHKENVTPVSGAEKKNIKQERKFLLVESASLDDLKGPLRGSARLKYTCMNVNNRYIALGSNTGSVHVFGRINLKHLQVVFTEVDPAPVCVAALCPANRCVAFATVNGHVIVMELNIEKRQKPDRLRLITEHLHSSVTCLTWDHIGEKLYSGDSNGKVVVTVVPSSKVKNLVVVPTEVIMKLESAIVQLDWFPDKLMVSTLFRCYFCVTSKQQYYHIGKKEREGAYGGCFFKPKWSTVPFAFCARPGSRLWEVDFDGNVKNTHMFKQLLAVPQKPVLNMRDDKWTEPTVGEMQSQSLNFPKLKVISDEFVLTWNKKKLFILDPMKDVPEVILWLEEDREMLELCTISRDLYLFYANGEVRKLQFLSVADALLLMAAKSKWSLAANAFLFYKDSILYGNHKQSLSKKMFTEMLKNLENSDQHALADKVRILIWQDEVVLRSDSESESSDNSGKFPNFRTLKKQEINSIIKSNGVYDDKVEMGESIRSRGASNDIIEIQNVVGNNSDRIENAFSDANLVVPMEEPSLNQSTKKIENDSGKNVTQNNEEKLSSVKHVVNTTETGVLDSQCDLSAEELDLINSDDIFANGDVVKPAKKNKAKHHKAKKVEKPNPAPTQNGGDETEVTVESKVEEDIFQVVPQEDSDIPQPLVVNRKKDEEVSILKSTKKKKVNTISFDGPEEGVISSQKKSLKKIQKQASVDFVIGDSRRNSQTSVSVTAAENSQMTPSYATASNATGSIRTIPRSASVPAFSNSATSPSALESQWSSYDGGSLDSSPSQSPLLQSYEGEQGDYQSSRKIRLTAVKDSLQSRLANTKKKILTKMMEKNLLPNTQKEFTNSPPSLMDTVDGLTTSFEQQDGHDEASIVEETEEVEECVIDVADLQACTDQAKRLLRDPNTLLNPELLVDILSKWIKQMNVSLQLLHTQKFLEQLKNKYEKCFHKKSESEENSTDSGVFVPDVDQTSTEQDREQGSDMDEKVNGEQDVPEGSIDSSQNISSGNLDEKKYSCDIKKDAADLIRSQKFVYVTDPFRFRPELKSSIAELTQKCFACGCYGNISKYVQPSVETIKFSDVCSSGYHGDEQFLPGISELLTDQKLNKSVTCEKDKHSKLDTLSENSDGTAEAGEGIDSISSGDVPNKGDNRCIQTSEPNHTTTSSHGHFGEDNDRNLFVSCYFFLLDLDTIQKDLYKGERTEEDLYKYWCTCLSCIQECCKSDGLWEKLDFKDIKSAVDLIKMRENTPSQLLGYVSKLFEVNPSKTVTFCQQSAGIEPLDVLFLCQHHGQSESMYFHQYMCARYKDFTSTKRISSNPDMYGHPLVSRKWLEILLGQTTHKKPLVDSQGNPRLWSHKVDWNGEDMISHLLKATTASSQLRELQEICTNAGYWTGSLICLKQVGQTEDILNIIFHLGDVQLLSLDSPYGYLPSSISEWQLCIQCYSNFSKTHSRSSTEMERKDFGDEDLTSSGEEQASENADTKECDQEPNETVSHKEGNNDGNTNLDLDTQGCHGKCITWNDMASLMMKYLDPITSVQILSKFHLPDGCLVSSFYRAGVLAAVINRQKKNVTHNLLEKVDAYLWAKKPNSLMPELQHVAQEEKSAQRSDRGQQPDYLTSILSSSVPVSKRYREDSECHWGVSTKIDRICRCCNLLLTHSVSHVEPGILVFDCGHAFHKVCCPNRTCLLCLKRQENEDQIQFV